MANGLVPDISPLAGGIGSLISERINQRLQQKALEGDQPSLSRLASRDQEHLISRGSCSKRQTSYANKD
jgi:hypothetical protein